MSNLSITTLEVLSSELFIEIFQYLNGYDIYRAFYGLNARLSSLVLTYGMNYIDLSETRPREIRQLFSDINGFNINSLILSSKYNDEQIEIIFNDNYFQSCNFDHLYSLTLDSVGIFTVYSIIKQRSIIWNLQCLIIRFRADIVQAKLPHLICTVLFNDLHLYFNSLKLLNLSIIDLEIPSFSKILPAIMLHSIPSNIYPSLQSLSINSLRIDNAEPIFSYFPNLHKLNAVIRLHHISITDDSLLNLTFCKFQITSAECQSRIHLLQRCLNLKQLIVYINPARDNDFSGIPWQDLIENYLIKLKQFQLNMNVFRSRASIDFDQNIYLKNFTENKFWTERKTTINIEDRSDDGRQTFQEIIIKFNQKNK